MTEPFYRRYILNLTVFICGALVMIYEITGSRIVAPFIGTSTYVWTSLIGVILGALSLGYWLGGRLADKRPDVKVLASVLFIAGGCVSATILLKDIILSFIAAATIGLEIKSVIAAILLFAPASVALGIVTPYAVKLKMASIADAGKTVGRLYALSTVGSIFGTFAAGFFLIPFVGSSRTLYLIAATLFALSITLVPLAFSRFTFIVMTLFVLAIAGNEFTTYFQRQTSVLHDIDTEYSRIRVFQAVEQNSGRSFQAIATDPYFVQSAMYLDSDEFVFQYTPFYHLIRHFNPGFQNALMIGGAGYTFPQDYLRTYDDAHIDVVEIDPKMTEIARRFFRLEDDPRLQIFHEDGRTYLNRSEAEKYDVVLMDAFGSLFSVPTHLTTIEAVRQIHRVLRDDGVVVFNLGSAIRGPGSRFLQAEFATYRAVFPHVFLFKVRSDYDDTRLQNLIIVAVKSVRTASGSDRFFPVRTASDSDRFFPVRTASDSDWFPPVSTASDSDRGFSPTDKSPEIARLLSHRYIQDFPLEAAVLTDDLAPVEYYNSFAQNLYQSSR